MIRTAGRLSGVALAAALLTVLATAEDMKTVQNGIVRYISTGFGNFWASFAEFVIVAFLPVVAIIAGLTSGGVKS